MVGSSQVTLTDKSCLHGWLVPPSEIYYLDMYVSEVLNVLPEWMLRSHPLTISLLEFYRRIHINRELSPFEENNPIIVVKH